MMVMSVRKLFSGALAALGGLAVAGAIVLGIWVFMTDGNGDRLPQEAMEGDFEESVLVNLSFADEELTADDPAALAVAERSTSRDDLIAYSIEEIIEGPDEEEQAEGLYTELTFDAESESVCGGEDFELQSEDGVFLVQLCRDLENAGDLAAEATALSQITQTLAQYPDVDTSTAVDPEGNCLAEADEDNLCHEQLPEGMDPVPSGS